MNNSEVVNDLQLFFLSCKLIVDDEEVHACIHDMPK